ncbi:MAG: ABC transporter permease [Phycisphaerales bacterium]
MTTADATSVSGVELARGIGVAPARGFWEEAWRSVLKRPAAVAGLTWIGLVALLAIWAPMLANGHPLLMRETLSDGGQRASSPLWEHLTAIDLLLLLGGVVGPAWMFWPMRMGRGRRLGWLLAAGAQSAAVIVACAIMSAYLGQRDAADWARALDLAAWFPWVAAAAAALMSAGLVIWLGRLRGAALVGVLLVAAVAAMIGAGRWKSPLTRYDYAEREAAGAISASYTLVPFSPDQTDTSMYVMPPGSAGPSGRSHALGTDPYGQDVLSQMLHACRLSISIGLVSTGLAVLIGVTVGALAGYFGGVVDLLLQRVIEVFMAIPVLFLLIVAAGVLPPELRSTYVMMAIIGCVTWTGAARFTRAEFFKLRNQDFVQSARALGLPLRSILFRHMLPNGVTPVLVDASFAVAAAILAEAVLSYLGLGPVGQPSWGKLLSSGKGATGTFVWWLAVFPGLAIFLTVLAYNLVGEALRDAIDPKLKKARV